MEKQVSRAALRLHKSQPAISHSLAHLRRIFDDPQLVRQSGKFELTSRAAELLPVLADVLEHLGALLEQPEFDPASVHRLFCLAMSDYGVRVLSPKMTPSLRTMAPGINVAISQASRESMLVDMIDGELDMVLGVFPEKISKELRTSTLFEEYFVCLADAVIPPIFRTHLK